MKILVADDEPLELLNVKKLLNDIREYDISLVENGLDAIEHLKKESVDLIFMDVKMPGLSGLETLELIRREWPETLVSIISAYSDFNYAKKAIELGASHYLLKPFSKNEFTDTFMKLQSQWNEKKSINILLKQSMLENMIFSEGSISNSEILKYFGFIPEVVVSIKCNLPDWKKSFIRRFHTIQGFLAPEPIGNNTIYVTSGNHLDSIKNALLQLNIEMKEQLSYGIGTSNNFKNSFANAIKDLQSKDESVVNKCMQYIQDNYFKPLSLADVAHAVHVSSSHLNRLLKKETAKTFTEILLNVRINKAKDLLKQDYNIEVVSDMVGFNSSAYFAVSFKKFTGISPSQYKREVG
ncbi:response regulator [Cytobacillus sp. FJAT-54145]|uniref:Response regulator n=1 Tax=Cytobacillus spartinae TaxID=3299023 RepID=A0ABW6KCV3_9BACI